MTEQPKKDDKADKHRFKADVDETMDETFPASDPPSWSGSTATGDEPQK